jgi:hypothetical protein
MPQWKTLNRHQVGPEDHHHRHLREELEEIHHHHLRHPFLLPKQACEEDGQEQEHEFRLLREKGSEIPELG